MNDTTKPSKPTITLDDLEIDGSILDVSQFMRKQKPRPKVPPKSKEALIAEAEERRRIFARLPKWDAEALVLVLRKTTCKRCGAEYLNPTSEGLLVRFRNRRKNDTIWEIAKHPAVANGGLPKETKILETQVEICQQCFEEGD